MPKAEKQFRKTLTPDEYLPVATIKSYFSWRTQSIKLGKTVDDSVEEDDEDMEEKVMKRRKKDQALKVSWWKMKG